MSTAEAGSLHPAFDGVHVVLGSASPRRFELLRRLGCVPEVIVADIDESQLPAESAHAFVERMAQEKASVVASQAAKQREHSRGTSQRPEQKIVIAADTIVVAQAEEPDPSSGDLVLGKPTGPKDAESMLHRLSGRTHQVMTAVAVTHLVGTTVSDVETSDVTFRSLSKAEMDWYISTDEWTDKAGGYAIQGKAAVFAESISGDPTNVIGLPLGLTVQLVQQVLVDRRA